MAVDNTAKSNGRGGRSRATKARSAAATEPEVTPGASNEAKQEDLSGWESEQDLVMAEVNSTVQKVTATEETTKNVIGETAMSTDNVVKITARPANGEGAIALSEPISMVWNRPVMPSEIEVAETISVAGVRPIAVSHLELAGSFLNGRPIEASSIKVLDMLPGDRPILASGFKMVDGAMLPGNRPIMASSPELLEASMLPGNRPIASNDTVDPESPVLMGYLD